MCNRREGHIHLACNFIEGGGDIVVPGAYRNQHQSYDHIHAVWSEQRAHDADCKVVSGRKEPRRARFSCRGELQICGGAGGKIEKRALFHREEHSHVGAACGGRGGRSVPWDLLAAGDVDGKCRPPRAFAR